MGSATPRSGFRERARFIRLPLDSRMITNNKAFTDPEDSTENRVDVRTTGPDEGEWDVGLVVVDGRVDYVDLRVRPKPLAPFVECLLDDIDDEQANSLLATLTQGSRTPPDR